MPRLIEYILNMKKPYIGLRIYWIIHEVVPSRTRVGNRLKGNLKSLQLNENF